MAKRFNYDTDVMYCKECLSLRILGGKGIPEYCDSCSSTDIGICTNEEFDKMFKEKYSRGYLEKEKSQSELILEKFKIIKDGREQDC